MEIETKPNYRLPREFAIKWMAALRSGEYQQATGWLKSVVYDPDPLQPKFKYCCLGVAGEICGCTMKPEQDGYLDNNDESSVGNLEKIPEELIGGKSGTLPHVLADMNDNGKTFNEIADWIQDNVIFYNEPKGSIA